VRRHVRNPEIAAILVSDVVGYSRLAGADEDRTLARLRALRSDLIDPAIAHHHGRIVKRTGDGLMAEFRSVVEAVRRAVAMQNGLIEHNVGVAADRRIDFRIGIHLGDVVEEADGDLMGDGVNIAARLEGIARPGAICLSEDAYRQVSGRLDMEVTDLGETPLKNIERPIRVYSLQVGEPSHAPAPAVEESARPRLSIVVLPFANIGGDASQEYFVDGVTESLTTDLSRIRGSFVIGRNTAFTYKGNAVDLKQIGRELNVRYVLEGSVQRGGNRMRVNVQLIDAEFGHHLWAERFDKPLADLFDMQDDIGARLAGAINSQLVEVEARRAEKAPNPNSMDLYFQGEACINRGVSPDNLARARDFYDRAMAADPNNVDALVGSARVDIMGAMQFAVSDPSATLAAAEAKLTSVLSLVPDHAHGHLTLGLVYMASKRATECEHALALDRNLATAHGVIGAGKLQLLRPEETEAHVLEALRLSPRDTSTYHWTYTAGVAKVALGLHDQALVWLRRTLEANRNHPYAHFVLGATLARLGRQDEARSAVKAGLALYPSFAVSRFSAFWLTTATDKPTYVSLFGPLWEAMHMAGVPE
jgi:TolB-like protein/tetratricopeptide (TPR) repeat protein